MVRYSVLCVGGTPSDKAVPMPDEGELLDVRLTLTMRGVAPAEKTYHYITVGGVAQRLHLLFTAETQRVLLLNHKDTKNTKGTNIRIVLLITLYHFPDNKIPNGNSASLRLCGELFSYGFRVKASCFSVWLPPGVGPPLGI